MICVFPININLFEWIGGRVWVLIESALTGTGTSAGRHFSGRHFYDTFLQNIGLSNIRVLICHPYSCGSETEKIAMEFLVGERLYDWL